MIGPDPVGPGEVTAFAVFSPKAGKARAVFLREVDAARFLMDLQGDGVPGASALVVAPWIIPASIFEAD